MPKCFQSLMKMLLYLTVLSLYTLPSFAQSTSRHDEIKVQLRQLASVIGSWQIEAQYISREGDTIKEVGTYLISTILDSSYLQWEAEMENLETGNRRQFLCLLTYDPDERQFVQTYFYSRTATKIVELGLFDEDQSVLTTSTVLDLPEGTVEQLRNELDLSK